MSRPAHLVSNHQATFAGTLNFENFNHRAKTSLDIPHDILVDFNCVLSCLLEEHGVGNSKDIRLAIRAT